MQESEEMPRLFFVLMIDGSIAAHCSAYRTQYGTHCECRMRISCFGSLLCSSVGHKIFCQKALISLSINRESWFSKK